MLKATPPYQAHTIFAGIALKPVVGIVVIIEFHIFVGLNATNTARFATVKPTYESCIYMRLINSCSLNFKRDK